MSNVIIPAPATHPPYTKPLQVFCYSAWPTSQHRLLEPGRRRSKDATKRGELTVELNRIISQKGQQIQKYPKHSFETCQDMSKPSSVWIRHVLHRLILPPQDSPWLYYKVSNNLLSNSLTMTRWTRRMTGTTWRRLVSPGYPLTWDNIQLES